MPVAISVDKLSKHYRIGTGQERPDTFAVALRGMICASYRNFRKLRWQASSVGEDGALDDSIFRALSDVSFNVAEGIALGVIGRNGAGKSTLLKVLSRITEPTSGTVRIKGRVSSLLEVGTGFHPELSGKENVYLNGTILGMSSREIGRRFEEIVEFSGVGKFLFTPIKRYSSGMKVRLAFAVAAHLEPDVLIIDEVLAVGDSEFQKKCLGKMKDVAHSGRTVVFVSHDMSAIDCLCSEAILLKNGSVKASGTTSQVISTYLKDAQASDNGVYDLSIASIGRVGFAQIIHRLELFANGRPTSTLTSYESASIDISFSENRLIRNARVAVAFEDSMGRRITTLSTFFSPSGTMDLHPNAKITCQIPQLLLGPGNYLLSVSVATKEDGLIDSIDQAGWFQVEWRNIYGVPEPHTSVFGPILTESVWRFSDC